MSDIGRWMGALSDLDQAEREAKNPPIFKKLFAGKTVEQEAMEVFAAKRKAQAQRDELKQWIQLTLGQSAWNELIARKGVSVNSVRRRCTLRESADVNL